MSKKSLAAQPPPAHDKRLIDPVRRVQVIRNRLRRATELLPQAEKDFPSARQVYRLLEDALQHCFNLMSIHNNEEMAKWLNSQPSKRKSRE